MPSPKRIETPDEELARMRRRLYVLRRICETGLAREIEEGQLPIAEGWDRGYQAAWEHVKRILDNPFIASGQEAGHGDA